MIAQRQAGTVGERGVRPNPEAEDDDVGRDRAVGGQHRADPAVAVGLESGDGGVGAHIDADALHGPVHRRPHVRVERGHRLRGLIDDGDGDAVPHQGLGHLHADVAPADHHSPPRLRAIEVRQERRAVVESLHPEYAGGVHAGQRRSHRDRAGRDDERVEAFPVRPPGGKVVSGHPPGREVDLLHLGSHPKVDAVTPVRVRRTGDQTLRPVDIAGHPVRDAAGRVGAVRSALERDDLDRVACDSLGLRGCAHPGRVRPDDDDPLGHGISAPHCLGRSVAFVATGQAAPVVVRISVPARTALVTGVFSAISASFARWSSSTPCRVISRSIHLVFRSLTT